MPLIILNEGRDVLTIEVTNKGDRPVQVAPLPFRGS